MQRSIFSICFLWREGDSQSSVKEGGCSENSLWIICRNFLSLFISFAPPFLPALLVGGAAVSFFRFVSLNLLNALRAGFLFEGAGARRPNFDLKMTALTLSKQSTLFKLFWMHSSQFCMPSLVDKYLLKIGYYLFKIFWVYNTWKFLCEVAIFHLYGTLSENAQNHKDWKEPELLRGSHWQRW